MILRDPTLDNKKCHYCEKEIPYSNNLFKDVVLFCDSDCFGWQEIEDD